MPQAQREVAVTTSDVEVGEGPRKRLVRKHEQVNYAEPKAEETDWIETPKKKVRTVRVEVAEVEADVAAFPNDDDDEDEEHEVLELRPRKKAPPKRRARVPVDSIGYDSAGQEVRKREFQQAPSEQYLRARIRAMEHGLVFLGRERCDAPTYPAEKFEIQGITSNYNVNIGLVNKCTCRDHAFRGSQYLCKHIIYVLLYVLRVRPDLQYQLAFTSNELREIFSNAPLAPTERVVEAVFDPNRKPVEGGCPICYMDFEPEGEVIVYCKGSCGNNVHGHCIQQWDMTKKREGRPTTCPYCRHHWVQG
ncbi:hypothetical protein CC78DRAFT_577897 [Lojkania enalia]|uniref:SWIM-type domain-containing protein n=1 Tax=Lojkania enalia TaxID=147567 RepID=A0A9P4KDF8_9PLEO|nr:hypothetical protein CC78DRAFT_577897 [Didymosphaeria enalia]